MLEKHEYFGEPGEEKKPWKRVFTVPKANVDTLDSIDPFSANDWMNKTKSKRGTTVGDMWDLSTELSEKRAKALGQDPKLEKKKQEHKEKFNKPLIRDNGGNVNNG